MPTTASRSPQESIGVARAVDAVSSDELVAANTNGSTTCVCVCVCVCRAQALAGRPVSMERRFGGLLAQVGVVSIVRHEVFVISQWAPRSRSVCLQVSNVHTDVK